MRQLMHRFTLRELAAASTSALSAELRTRISLLKASHPRESQHALITQASSRLARGLEKAEAASEVVAALAEVEGGAAAAVEALGRLNADVRAGDEAQSLLNTAFASIIGQRALVQASTLVGHAEPLLRPASELGAMLENIVEDSQAFTREKFGDRPEARLLRVTARGDAPRGDEGVLLEPFVAFPLHELLKNAMGAHVRLVGADKLDRLPPVEVRYGVKDGTMFVGVTDYGGGWPDASSDESAVRFLHTTNPSLIMEDVGWTYSRNFGSTFEGLGMGLPMARLHAKYLGGELHLHPTTATAKGAGVHAAFLFDVTGEHREPLWDASS